MKEIIEKLISKKETISCMESCTGGFLANEITNIEGSSNVFKLSYVTYCNETKVLVGVNKYLIEKYSVYSTEVAENMAKVCSQNSDSDYGIGITGELTNEQDKVYIGIYVKNNDKYFSYIVNAGLGDRKTKKERIVWYIEEKLKEIIN